MFGFGRSPDHYSVLLEHLVESWGMRVRFAEAFLSKYRESISKIHEQGLANLKRLSASGTAGEKLLAMSVEPMDYALVGQAYQAYLTDLRHGKHVGSDIELAIWGILANRSDLLDSIDRGLAGFVNAKVDERFPNLFGDVFS